MHDSQSIIRQHHVNGLSQRAIGAAVGLSQTAVRWRLRKMGLVRVDPPAKLCAWCKKQCSKRNNGGWCSNACYQAVVNAKRHHEWKNGGQPWRGTTSLSAAIISVSGRKCNQCQLEEWQGSPIPLEVNHKDGNGGNHAKDNVELLCPNCHAQTPTYKAKNRGRGRQKRRERERLLRGYKPAEL